MCGEVQVVIRVLQLFLAYGQMKALLVWCLRKGTCAIMRALYSLGSDWSKNESIKQCYLFF